MKKSIRTNNNSNSSSKRRLLIFVIEILFITIILAGWLNLETVRQSKHLLVLFLYSFPCQFLIAIVPHEPVFLYFSKFYAPLPVTLASVSGTLLTELLNYSTFKFIVDLKSFNKLKYSGFVGKMIEYFYRAPFLALWVAGFTPVPFYPFRFLVVLANYPVWKYILAVFTSRAPRFFLLALLGKAFKIPDSLLIILFAILILVANVPVVKKVYERYRQKKLAADVAGKNIKS